MAIRVLRSWTGKQGTTGQTLVNGWSSKHRAPETGAGGVETTAVAELAPVVQLLLKPVRSQSVVYRAGPPGRAWRKIPATSSSIFRPSFLELISILCRGEHYPPGPYRLVPAAFAAAVAAPAARSTSAAALAGVGPGGGRARRG